MRILIVEDNRGLVANLFDYFEARGHTLDAAPDGLTGLHLACAHEYDVIVLDWMLPRLEGPEVLRRLREEAGKGTPVLMLTARQQLDDKLAGFRAGADDYLTKPFAMQELEARLEALCARAQGRGRQRELCVGELRLDLQTLELTRAGRRLHVYPAGRKLLEVLMRASPAVVPRARLERALWGDDPPDGDLLRSHLHELRRAIETGFDTRMIQTVARVGYRIVDPQAQADEPAS